MHLAAGSAEWFLVHAQADRASVDEVTRFLDASPVSGCIRMRDKNDASIAWSAG